MDRIERVVVHLREATRLADERSEPHGRLALLLLDNLAEVLLYREAEYQLAISRMSGGFEECTSVIEPLEELATEFRSEARLRAVSKTRERKIRHDFGEKSDYLVELGLLEPVYSRTLKKLHAYRNEAYHRDTLRAETLRSAVDIYLYLCCELMKELPVHSYRSDRVPEYLAPYLAAGTGLDGFTVQARVADDLLAERHLDHLEVNALLRAHLLSRLADMRDNLKAYAGEWDSLSTPAQILHQAQIPADAIKTMADVLNIPNMKVPHDLSSLAAWEQRAATLADYMPIMESFAMFADIEDDFETLETQIRDLAMQLEAAIQDGIDALRGK